MVGDFTGVALAAAGKGASLAWYVLVSCAVAFCVVFAFSHAFGGWAKRWLTRSYFRPEDVPLGLGRVAVVTGGNAGIGLEVCKALARRGWRVIIACRSEERGSKAVAAVTAAVNLDRALNSQLPPPVVSCKRLDLASLASVRDFAEGFNATGSELHLLVNNGGVMMCPFALTPDGFEMQFGINAVGHFVLTVLLAPVLVATAAKADTPPRVVFVSSKAHETSYPTPIDFGKLKSPAGYFEPFAYGQSKLAGVLLAKEFARRLAPCRVLFNAVHPGVVSTGLQRHVPNAFGAWGPLAPVLRSFVGAIDALAAMGVEEGASTTLYAAVSADVAAQRLCVPR